MRIEVSELPSLEDMQRKVTANRARVNKLKDKLNPLLTPSRIVSHPDPWATEEQKNDFRLEQVNRHRESIDAAIAEIKMLDKEIALDEVLVESTNDFDLIDEHKRLYSVLDGMITRLREVEDGN